MPFEFWVDFDGDFADDIGWMDQEVALVKTPEAKTTTWVCACWSIVSHHKIAIFIDDEITHVTLSRGGDSRLWKIKFIKRITGLFSSCAGTHEDIIVSDFYFFSGESDDSFDEWDISIFWDEDDDISSLELAESRSDFVDDDKISLVKLRLHTLSHDRERVEDEKSDKQDYSHDEHEEWDQIKKIEEYYFYSVWS